MGTRYLFVCGAMTEEQHKVLDEKSKVVMSQAAESFQWSFIKGFIANNSFMDVLSTPYLPTYPKYTEKYVSPHKSRLSETVNYESIPIDTVFYKKWRHIKRDLYRKIVDWCVTNEGDKIYALVYNTESFQLEPLIRAKKRFPRLKICVIITDMYEDAMNYKSNRSFLKRIQIGMEVRSTRKSLPFVDKYVLLSECMKERLLHSEGNYCIVEGIYSDTPELMTPINQRKKAFLYTGSLQTYANIDTLIEAFKQIDNNDYKLIICGDGPLSSYVSENARKYQNIDYRGNISRNDVIKLQRQVKFLINPRQPSIITRYSFPSKTIEYLVSGTPTIMYRLDGIPVEYYDHCITVTGSDSKSLTECLNNAIAMSNDELTKIVSGAQRFILEEKNAKVQMAKVIAMMEK